MLKSANVTFTGGKGAEKVDPYKWGGVSFPLNKPVLLDASKSDSHRHILSKLEGGGNRFFTVEALTTDDPENPFDHNGDGNFGGSLPKAKRGRKPKAEAA